MRRIRFLLLLMFAGFGIGTAYAQDLSGLSFALDPGHGKDNANQGPTGLREADVNLNVALFLRDYLRRVGIDTVVMTRVDDSINPSLSQREDIANSAGVDWFHSVHHNATGLPTNVAFRYTLMLYEEQLSATQFCSNGRRMGTGEPAWPGRSDVMSDHMGRRIWQALRTSDYRLRLDWTFYGGCNGGFNLGVLNDLQMPGQLSEATFHDHAWEEAKLRSPDFNLMEARALFTAILDYFETDSLTTGALIGYLSDFDTGEFLNGAEVLLLPDSLRYSTDNFNNGLYVFDDLPPGTYTVQASKPGFTSGEETVEVLAHAFNFADFRLVDITPPAVTQLTASPSDTAADVYRRIVVSFSRAMDQESTLQAFSLEPAVAGKTIWAGDNLRLGFEPKKRFEFDTEYRVRIAATATDVHGNPLDGDGDGTGGDPYEATFRTAALDTAFPLVYDFYPAKEDSGIFVRDVFRVVFSKPLDPGTVIQQNIFLKTGFDRPEEVAIDYVDQPPFGLVTFVPRVPLKPGAKYFLTLLRNLSDRSGNPMPAHFQWTFVTDPAEKNLFIYDDFESDSLAWRPAIDPLLSQKVIIDSVGLALSQEKVLSDSTSMRVGYAFQDPGGTMGLLFSGVTDSLSAMLIEGQEVAVYVYGDGSGLRLRPIFADADGTELGSWRTARWTSWGLARFTVSADSLTPGPDGNGVFDGNALQLSGLQLAPGDTLAGRVWFDDVLKISDALPTLVEGPRVELQVPQRLTLFPNYPNPFAPSAGTAEATTIRYQLQNPGTVALEVFNLRGQRVRTLVKRAMAAGEHIIRWDGRDGQGRPVSGGVYLIRLRAGDQVVSRKAVVLR